MEFNISANSSGLKGQIDALEKVYDLTLEIFGIAAYNINVGIQNNSSGENIQKYF